MKRMAHTMATRLHSSLCFCALSFLFHFCYVQLQFTRFLFFIVEEECLHSSFFILHSSLTRHLLQCLQQEVVELLYRGDEHALVGRVGRTEGRSEGNHVEARMGGTDDAAFESSVDDLHLGLFAELDVVALLHGLQDGRVHVGLPA